MREQPAWRAQRRACQGAVPSETRSVHLHVSIDAPGWRQRQAKTIRPQKADMVRMRSSSILVKGSNTKRDSRKGVLFCVGVYIQSRVDSFMLTMEARRMRKQPAWRVKNRACQGAQRIKVRSVLLHMSAADPKVATTHGEGYPPAKSIYGKDEVKFDSG